MKQRLMDDPRHCAQCGAVLSVYALEGMCGNCLLQPGLEPLPELLDEPADEPRFPASGAGSKRSPNTAGVGRFGDYELLEEIARGGMGVVYRARQVSLERIVAVKMLLAGPLATKDFVQRFRTESAAAASLQHPNIVAIHEVGFADGQHFFAMEYVEGLTLGQLVAKGPLPARQAATYLKTIAAAIHFAHERNVLHRDLKPSNVLIDSATDQPRVTDFGLDKRLEAETELTLSGQMLGSPNYMSPEQATAKRGTVGKRSDVYSLGAILYHLLTGRPPFQGETLTDVLRQLADDDPLAPHLLTPRVPHDLETICLKCLEKEPAKRYQTAEELADELDRFLRDEPIHAHPVTRAERTWRWCQRKPALAGLIVALHLVLALGLMGILWQWRRASFNARAEAKQHQLADENRERADQNVYDSDMSLAQHAWDDGDLGRTLSLLEAHCPRSGEPDRRGFEWFYFWNLCLGDQRMTLTNHSQTVNSVAFSPDGQLVATGSAGDPVHLWDSATGELLRTLPEQQVFSLAFAPDGQTLGVGGRDQVAVWNLETGQVIFKQEDPFGQFRIAFSPVGTWLVIGKRGGRLFSTPTDGGSAELWDYATRERKHVFPESGGHVALSLHGNRLATGNWNQTVKIWDLGSGQFLRSLKTGAVIGMALSPDGQALATSYWDPEVKLWDVATGGQIGALNKNPRKVWSLAFSPDGQSLATGGTDQTIGLWDVATRQQAERLRGHGSEVVSVAFSADGQTLASGSRDKTAMLWSVHPNRTKPTVAKIISRPVFSRDGQLIAAGIGHNQVAAWDVATLQQKAVFTDAFDALGFSADGSTLVTRGTKYFLRTFDVASQAARTTIPGRPAEATDSWAALSPDGQILMTGLDDGTLMFSDAKTGALIKTTHHARGNRIFQIDFSPNGKLLATAGREAEANRVPAAEIWELATQRKAATLLGHTEVVLSVGFSPDGQTLATSGADDSIKFWDTATWKELPPALGQKEYVISLTFSPNGRTLATASADGTMRLWNVATRRELASLKLDADAVQIAFSPDGQTLAVRNWDGSLRLWRAPVTGKKRK
jgi:WD40 repeat protein